MWDKISNIAKSAAAMLQSGKTPPNTPVKYQEELGAINFLRSKKFFVAFSAIVLLMIFFASSIFILFLTATLPTITVPYVTLVVEFLKIFALIITFYIGIQGATDFRWGSNSNVELSQQNQNITETLEEKRTYIEESRSRPDYEED
jgi:ABC-type multidrug transport system fused ATPase/permease subunit